VLADGEIDEDASKLSLGPDLQGKPCLFNSEIQVLLETHRSVNAGSSQQSTEVLEKTLAYVTRFSKFKNKDSVRQVRRALEDLADSSVPSANVAMHNPLHAELLARGVISPNGGLNEFEIAALCSLCPEVADEAIALIPTLDRIEEEDLAKILTDLANFRRFK